MNRVFADTSYFIAVIVPNDVAHGRAQALGGQSLHLITTSWIMAELAAYLSPPRSSRSEILNLKSLPPSHPSNP